MRRLGFIVAAAALLTLSACGGGSGASSGPTATGLGAVKLIAGSADKAAAAKTARMSGEVTIEARGQRRTLPLDGALDFGSGAFEFTYGMSQLGIPGAGHAELAARVVDGVMYVNLGDLAGGSGKGLSTLTGAKTWMQVDLTSLGVGSSGAGGGLTDANPGGTLDSLRGAGDVSRLGTETLRGVETTHYKATIDPQKALEKTPADLRDKVQKGLDALGGSIPAEVWIDGDGQTRKIAMNLDTDSGTVSTNIEYYDFGADVDVSAPPADDVFDLSQMLGGFKRLAGTGSPAV